jgi:hypothetical protein
MRVPLPAARITAFIGINEHARRERKKKKSVNAPVKFPR